jgi:hypothetical protein
MSGLYENLLFSRGHTWGATQTTGSVYLEGREFIEQDQWYGTGGYIKLRVCRNNSGGVLLAGRAVKFNNTAGKLWTDVAGYCTALGERTAIVDEFIPPAGVPNQDLFFAVIAGPVLATLLSGGATVAVGDYLGASTGTTTGSTDAGHMTDLNGILTANTATGEQVLQVFGTAMSSAVSGAATTSYTAMLINAGFPNW